MNVTSMMSNGYLQPANQPINRPIAASSGQSAALALQEQQVLSQERALKAGPGNVSTTYRYTVGPDGRRYITGAEVVIEADEATLDRIPGGVRREELKPQTEGSEKSPKAEKTSDARPEKQKKSSDAEDPNADVIRELQQTEREVVAHEAAHQAAGGQFAGPVSYTYTQGPDGKKYITGGEVPIHVPAGDDPEETLRNMAQVQRAALAPGNPSGQDLSVAAQAGAAAAEARQEIARQSATKTGVSSIRSDMRFERIRSGQESDPDTQPAVRPISADESKEAYERASSQYGLWVPGRGFEPGTGRRPDDRLNIAA